MKIELILDEESQGFFSQLKSGNNALVVPIDKWSTFIQERLGTTRVKDPNFKIAGSYVITDQKAFELFVGELHSIYYGRPDRLVTKEYGAFRFAGKLDQKRVMPPALSYDIFDVGHRQPGSFRSK